MKTKKNAYRRPRKARRLGAESIMRGIREIESMLRDGATPEERFTVRTIQSPEEPKEFAPADVRKLRQKLNISQPLFAELLGASTILVQSWEQGKRKPNRMACRLLEEVDREPARWIARFRRDSAA